VRPDKVNQLSALVRKACTVRSTLKIVVDQGILARATISSSAPWY